MSFEALRMHSREELQSWVAQIEDRIEELEALVKRPLAPDLDSLDVLEAFLVKRYKKVEHALVLTERAVVSAAAGFVGLVLILATDDARWALNLEDAKFVYYRMPVVRFHTGDEECPASIVTASLVRRTGHFMRDVVGNWIEQMEPPAKPAKPAKATKNKMKKTKTKKKPRR
jgi:hypothetical protein